MEEEGDCDLCTDTESNAAVKNDCKNCAAEWTVEEVSEENIIKSVVKMTLCKANFWSPL